MGEGMGVIEVEGVDHPVIVEIRQGLHGGRAVPVRAADDDPMLAVNGADHPEYPLDDPVPHFDINAVGFIHDFEHQAVSGVPVARCQLRPDWGEHGFDIIGSDGIGGAVVVKVKDQIDPQFACPGCHIVQNAQNLIGDAVIVLRMAETFKMDGEADNIAAQLLGVDEILPGE